MSHREVVWDFLGIMGAEKSITMSTDRVEKGRKKILVLSIKCHVTVTCP